GDTATYNYDAVGNLTSITRQNSTALSVVEFSPNSGPIGTTVTIYGTGFSATANQNTVTFNGTVATVNSATATQLVATVPSGATTGLINVTTPGGSASSAAAFTVTGAAGTPTITNFTPTTGVAGASVTITGTNFQTSAATEVVRFNNTRAIISTTNSTTITTSVPKATGSGRISVTTAQGQAVSTGDFIIPPPGFTVTDIQSSSRMTIGQSKTVTISTATKKALVLFDATAGQRVSLKVTASTLPNGCSGQIQILRPDGLIVGFGATATAFARPCTDQFSNFIEVLKLTVSGTYTVFLNPFSNDTGSVTFTLYDVPPDVTGTITPNGSSVTVNLPTPGQNAKLTFSGTAGQKVSLKSDGTTCATVSILKPDGVTLFSQTGACSNAFVDAQNMPVTGTYTVFVDPDRANTGNFTLTLYTFVDILETVTPSGPAKTANIT